jgi:hypothetical protein
LIGSAPFRAIALIIALPLTPLALGAQMTVTGRVTSGDQPIQGATVSIRELDISARTNAEGVYSFIIRSALIRGQTVTITARHSRFGAQAAQLAIVGGSVVQNFSLRTFEQPAGPAVPGTPGSLTPRRDARNFASRRIDSTALLGVAGPVDLATALAGQIPGLDVIGGTHGGSSVLRFRGARSLHGSVQPLIVVDGVALDNASYTGALQQFGLGGFDYGTRLNDISLDDIATVTLVHGAAAVPKYGLRAANGVVEISTKRGGSGRGWDPVVSLRVSGQSAIRLPSFQNRYGQGLNGQFEFFDGQGGGINDDVAENWGPALDGQPIPQASLTEPRRPEVRHWLPHPSGFDNYLESGRTIDASIALNATRQWASGRVALNTRTVNGVTPNSSARRLGVSFGGTAQPTPRLNARASVQVIDASAENRPGTGFDGSNPISQFTRIGRQVDLDALRSPIVSGNEQIDWIYTGSNNPFFQPLRNSNDDARTHLRAGGAFNYELGRGFTATLTAGRESSDEHRNLDVATGWTGGYPTALGRRDFSGGGTERQALDISERTIGLAISSAPTRRYGFVADVTVGAETRANTVRRTVVVVDAAAQSAGDTSDTDVTSLYAFASASRNTRLFLDVGLRAEQASNWPSSLGTAFLPSASITYDLVPGRAPGAGRTLGLGTARIRGSWWEAGNEVTPATLRRIYAGGGTDAEPVLGVAGDASLPERTRGLELSTELASISGRLAFDLTAYSERSRELLQASPLMLGQSATISNRGFEAQVRVVALGDTMADANGWIATASFARNRNNVERLGGGIEEMALSPSLWGATLVAREGEPLGVIVGNRYLRDANGALLLRNGLPIVDGVGIARLGNIEPDWSWGLRNRLRRGAAELSFALDGRVGGKVFSATNLWGSFAGSLESTVAGRETGLLIAGVDSVTGAANADTVSTQAYYHALGAIHEAWVYDASFWKLREARLSYSFPMRFVPGFREHTLRLSLVGRNLITSAKAPNIDPETALSAGVFQGFEMGQLPTTRSIGLQVSVAP